MPFGGVIIATFEGVYYIEQLERGRSKQAPAGFLSGIAEFGADEILPDALFDLIAQRTGMLTPAGSVQPQVAR